MQQPRPGAEGAPRAAAHVLFMWAPGGVFFEKECFLVSSIFAHHFPSLFPAHFGNAAKQTNVYLMLMVFVSQSVSWEQAWALEIAEAQLVRNSHVFF